ncbi:MAG: hypothetical protein HYU52_14140 [Acidobacteria bacterium]|nr:hypothetical protein [Acidobacteriota bacterium]
MSIRNVRFLGLTIATILLITGSVAAGDWTGSVGFSLTGQSESGNPESFATQSDLQDGASIESLSLTNGEIRLNASGFAAQPAGSVELIVRPQSPWRFDLRHDTRRSLFALTASDSPQRRDDWSIDRWTASGSYDGLRLARLGLSLRRVDRRGEITQPFFGLNEQYLLSRDVDDTTDEATLSVETKTLPARIIFEQSFTRYVRRDRRSPAGANAIGGVDPDLLAAASSTRDDESLFPTSRLITTWATERVQVAGTATWSPAQLDGSGVTSSTFAIDGGSRGTVELIDDAVSKADRELFGADLRFAWRVAPMALVRVDASTSDTSTDASLTGERILRMLSPEGSLNEVRAPIDEATIFDLSESRLRVEVETGRDRWTTWGGGFLAERDTKWTLPGEPSAPSRNSRSTAGAILGGRYQSTALMVSAELEHGTFEHELFRTDPRTVDRLTVRGRSSLAGGWSTSVQGRVERSEADDGDAADRDSSSIGANLAWLSPDGRRGLGLDVDLLDVRTETLLSASTLPSIYDITALSTTLSAHASFGRMRISGSASRTKDAGDTWPLEAWNARARIGYEILPNAEISLFGESWSYDETRADADDYDVRRFGVSILWRLR